MFPSDKTPKYSFSKYDTERYPSFDPMVGLFKGAAVTRLNATNPTPTPTQKVLPCFKEDTKILCYINDAEIYVNIQDIRPGMKVKTLSSGYLPVDMIGKRLLKNPGDNQRVPNRIYKCSKNIYHELTDDLYMTGHHSILVGELTDELRQEINDLYGRVFVTENRYRLPCFLDIKSEVVEKEEEVMIYHLALENKDYLTNYGIYANGLLVETCSRRYLKEYSNMELIQ